MKKNRAVVPVIMIAAFAMFAAGGAATVKPQAEPSKTAAFNGTQCVCPHYPWAFHESYWSYYATICETGEPVNLDAEPFLNNTSCSGTGECLPDCLIVSGGSTLVLHKKQATKPTDALVDPTKAECGKTRDAHYVEEVASGGKTDPKADKGLAEKGAHRLVSRELDDLVINKKPFKSVVRKGRYDVVVTVGGKKFHARLYIYELTPRNHPKKLVAYVGNQCKEQEHIVYLDATGVMHKKRCCTVSLDINGTATKFQVILSRDPA